MTGLLKSTPPARKTAPEHSEQIGDGGSAAGTLRQWIRTWKFWILLALIFTVAILVPYFARSAGTDSGILSAANPAPEGAMAVAEILDQQGVEVRPTDTLEETLRVLESAPARSTLMLHDRLQLLAPEQLHELAAAASGQELVLVEPSLPILDVLADDIESAGVVPEAEGTVAPSCSLEDAAAAGPISKGGLAYRGPHMCYSLNQATGTDSALYIRSGDGSATVLGNGAILSNDRLAAAGNAALALRTLGREPLLVWYQPSLADVAQSDQPPTLGELTPPWVNWFLLWLAVVALLAMVWKGRRMGPLVPEPLPVQAKAAETIDGRARLYQRFRAVDQVAGNLRSAALVRMARHFRLGHGASAQQIAAAAAEHSALPAQEVHRRLLGHWPNSEAEMILWAQQLEALEKEVTAL